MIGAVLSSTVTTKLVEVLLPSASVTVYVTVVAPLLKVSPLACVLVTVGADVQLSETTGAVQVTI